MIRTVKNNMLTSCRGAAAVETALALPMAVILIVLVLQMGLFCAEKLFILYTAHMANRAASVQLVAERIDRARQQVVRLLPTRTMPGVPRIEGEHVFVLEYLQALPAGSIGMGAFRHGEVSLPFVPFPRRDKVGVHGDNPLP